MDNAIKNDKEENFMGGQKSERTQNMLRKLYERGDKQI